MRKYMYQWWWWNPVHRAGVGSELLYGTHPECQTHDDIAMPWHRENEILLTLSCFSSDWSYCIQSQARRFRLISTFHVNVCICCDYAQISRFINLNCDERDYVCREASCRYLLRFLVFHTLTNSFIADCIMQMELSGEMYTSSNAAAH